MLKCPKCGAKILPSIVAADLGRRTSELKAAAARENGKKGGRPKKIKEG